ncbi:transmembrane protein 179-like isoform X2 [Tubulanus polymorphus]|uniref:transmembrane protein 179-like isoform X2 n=1 Tax=Tubulanus polymorphus TaxID=672921 RepID=UPI003DA4540E
MLLKRGKYNPEMATRAQVTLRWVQVILYVATFVFSLLVCVPMATTTKDFNDNCLLYGSAEIETGGPNGTMLKPEWGEFKTCGYTTYVNVLTCIYSVVWCSVFLLVTKKDNYEKGKADKIIFPTLLFNTVLFTFELIGSCVMSLGLRKWCQALETNKGGFTCEATQYLRWPGNVNGSRFYILLTISEISSWLVTITTGGLSAIAAERFCRSYWAPNFRYTIRYENGLVGMDMKNIVADNPSVSYNAVENSGYADNANHQHQMQLQQQQKQFQHEQIHQVGESSNDLEDEIAQDQTLPKPETDSKINVPKPENPWANENAPLRKKYVVVYSAPPGYSIPEDMQLISTV